MHKLFAVGAFTAALALASGAAAAPGAGQAADHSCFFVTQWRGWSAPSDDVLYLAVNRDVYRVDLAGRAYGLHTPGRFLVSKVRGSSSICSAVDLDLAVADTTGYSTPLFARSLRRLTPDEVAAIPAKDRPR